MTSNRQIAYFIATLAMLSGVAGASDQSGAPIEVPSEIAFPSDTPGFVVSQRDLGHSPCGAPGCAHCSAYPLGTVYGGVDFLLIQAHWSEAVAFARGTQTATSLQTQAVALDFDYEGSLRAFLGYRPGDGPGEFRFTYSHLQGEVDVSGAVAGPGQFIVDPFGNLVGAVAIIDPSDARGVGTVLTGGDFIATHASVDLNAYDIEFASAMPMGDTCWDVAWSAGVRIADIRQYYDSVVTTAGVLTSRGDFAVDYVGAGPRLGVEFRRSGPCLTFYANGHGSLLLGDYSVSSSANPVPVFQAGQAETMTRLIPALETELGAHWRVSPRMTLSGGWLFQAWMDMGTSGGTFGGFFTGADDANVMSFDGLFLRGEWAY